MSVLAAIQAMSDPTRFEILHLVRDREMPAGEIARRFPITRPAVSQHLRVLRDAGLLDERRVGTRRLYIARPEGLDELRAFIEQFWLSRLKHLKRAAEAAERSTRRR